MALEMCFNQIKESLKKARKNFLILILMIFLLPIVIFVTLPCVFVFLYLYKIMCGAYVIIKNEIGDGNPVAVRVVGLLVLSPIIVPSILLQYIMLFGYSLFCELQQFLLRLITLFKIKTFTSCSKENLFLYNSPNLTHNIYD